ncbi:hypothetical protein DFQ26_002591 [Actinomortierella ambigua]|nr:hypothetical protein DFQ26_002591 [Actinomortierella ambigua]
MAIKTLSLKDFDCSDTRHQFLTNLRDSLRTIGTFYIKDHGVPSDLTKGAMETIREYFSLPLEEKKKMHITNSRHFRGYKLMGEEFTNNVMDHREQLQLGPEREAIKSFVPGASREYSGLEGPNQWPATTVEKVPQFKPCMVEFMEQLALLSSRLMEAIALSLGLEPYYFKNLFGINPYYRLKAAKYPSVQKESTIGCGAHKDTGFLTVLLQDMVGGLQGQDPLTKEWKLTQPIPDTFVVTLGSAMERLTSGYYQATVHRVLNNTSGIDRYSIPFFYDPCLDAMIPSDIPDLKHLVNLPLLASSPSPSPSHDEHALMTTEAAPRPSLYARRSTGMVEVAPQISSSPEVSPPASPLSSSPKSPRLSSKWLKRLSLSQKFHTFSAKFSKSSSGQHHHQQLQEQRQQKLCLADPRISSDSAHSSTSSTSKTSSSSRSGFRSETTNKPVTAWSNGDHIFDTVQRCHPEVYDRWYTQES